MYQFERNTQTKMMKEITILILIICSKTITHSQTTTDSLIFVKNTEIERIYKIIESYKEEISLINYQIDSLKSDQMNSLKNDRSSYLETVKQNGLSAKVREKDCELKSSSSRQSRTITGVDANSSIKIYNFRNNYFQIEYKGQRGWLDYLWVMPNSDLIYLIELIDGENSYSFSTFKTIGSTRIAPEDPPEIESSNKIRTSRRSTSSKRKSSSTQCTGRTQKGARCRNMTKSSTGQCHHH